MDIIGADELRQAWRQRRQLPAVQEWVLQEAFHLIRGGRVATDATLAARTGLSLETVGAARARLQEDGRIVYAAGAGGVIGAFGLSLLPTPHALSLDGRPLFTWCALDAVGIPAGLVTQVSHPALRLWVAMPAVGRSVVGDM